MYLLLECLLGFWGFGRTRAILLSGEPIWVPAFAISDLTAILN